MVPVAECDRQVDGVKQSYEDQLLRQQQEAGVRERRLADEVASVRLDLDARTQALREMTRFEVGRVVLFGFGEDELVSTSVETVSQIADVLARYPDYRIRVEGHTDDRPIGPSLMNRFESNWELSAARAATVARYLLEAMTVDPARMQVVGYGKYRPIAENVTPDGRARNRRVEVVIYEEPPARVPLRKEAP